MRKVKLGKISKVVSGSTAPKAEAFNEKEGLPFVRAGHLEALCNGEDINNLPKVKEGSGKLVAVPKHTVIFAKSGMSIMKNRIYTTTEKVYIVNHLAGVICNQQFIIPQYLKYFLLIFKPSTLIVDESYPSIRLKDIENIYIPLPDLQIQHKIVQVLDKAQALIDKRKEQIKLCDELIQSLFYDMFGDPVTNPKKFVIGTIRDMVADVKYGTSKKPNDNDGEFPILRMNNITYNGYIDLTDLKYIDLNEEEREKYLVRKGDVLFNRTNSKELVGKTAVYKYDYPMAFAGYLIRVRTNKENNPEYLSAVLNPPYGKATLRGMCKNIIGMANINAEELQNIKVPLPPVELQNLFAEKVRKIEHQKQLLQQSLALLEDNFNSLMQKAFKGELFQ